MENKLCTYTEAPFGDLKAFRIAQFHFDVGRESQPDSRNIWIFKNLFPYWVYLGVEKVNLVNFFGIS